MAKYQRYALNRIVCPGLELRDFFRLAHELGLSGIELRNDLVGKGVIDSLPSHEVRTISKDLGMTIHSINALQRFNVRSFRPQVERELDHLVRLALEIDCKGLVLCPMNDNEDARTPEQRFEETVAALTYFRCFFEDNGILGLIEPLGFAESSLRSKYQAIEAIVASEGKNYRIVHDTFHHVIGPDDDEVAGGRPYDVALTGLVHLSCVPLPTTTHLPVSFLRDHHRVLVSDSDRLQTKKQCDWLLAHGYEGPFSFEPFAPELQQMDYRRLKDALEEALAYFVQ